MTNTVAHTTAILGAFTTKDGAEQEARRLASPHVEIVAVYTGFASSPPVAWLLVPEGQRCPCCQQTVPFRP